MKMIQISNDPIYRTLIKTNLYYCINLKFSATALHFAAGFAVTAGSHRLWAHRSYKATWQLKLILVIFQTLSFQVTFIIKFW